LLVSSRVLTLGFEFQLMLAKSRVVYLELEENVRNLEGDPYMRVCICVNTTRHIHWGMGAC